MTPENGKRKNGSKKQSRVLTTVALLGVFILLLIVFTDLNMGASLKQLDEPDPGAAATEQLMLIVDRPQDPFWAGMQSTARIAGEPLGIAIETYPLSYYERYSKSELMEMAVLEGVDGIMIETLGDEEIDALARQARSKGTAVIYLQNVDSNSAANCVIGVNDFEIAAQYLAVLNELPTEGRRVAVYPSESTGGDLLQILTETLTSGGWSVDVLTRGSESGFDAADTVRNVLDRPADKAPQAMICLNADDTVNAVQALVDYNAVGRFSLVGYYLTQEIQDALNKDLLQATISIDAGAMGRQAVESFFNLKTVGRTSELEIVDTRIVWAGDADQLPVISPPENSLTGDLT